MTEPLSDQQQQDQVSKDRRAVIVALAGRAGGANLYDILEALPQWDRETLRADCDALVLAGKLLRLGIGRTSQYSVPGAGAER